MRVAFFTEGGGRKGFGHISRCRALGAEFEARGFESVFFVREYGDTSKAIGKRQKLCWGSPPKIKADIAVFDSYEAGKETLEAMAAEAKTALFFDDTNRLLYPDGFVLNSAFGAQNLPYPKENEKYLLGKKYIPLRPEFRVKKYKKNSKNPKKILLSFGGADNKNAANKISAILQKMLKGAKISVVSGKTKRVKKEKNVKRYGFLEAKEFRKAMLKSDMGIFSCSQTLYEALATGLSSIGVLTETNQQSLCDTYENAISLNERFFAHKLKRAITKIRYGKKRRALPSNGAALVVDRLVKDALKKSEIEFCDVRFLDSKTKNMIRVWRNTPFVRVQMTTSREILEIEHTAWLNSLDKNDSKKSFLAYIGGEPFGACNLRIDEKDKEGEFGFYIFKKELLGFGLGARMCEEFLGFAARSYRLERITSTVIKSNLRSLALHKKLGFLVCDEDEKNFYLKR